MIRKITIILALIMFLTACSTGQPITRNQQEMEENVGQAQPSSSLSTSSSTEAAASPAIPVQTQAQKASRVPAGLVGPEHFIYKGAFRLPDDAERPLAFAYGGEAITHNPEGDHGSESSSTGKDGKDGKDSFPGSLFIMGHNRMPYGELPDGNQVAEISIPEPVLSRKIGELSQAEFIQPFSNIADGWFTAFDEIPRAGIEYLDVPATGPLLHVAWGQHFHDEPETQGPTHAWFSPTLDDPQGQGSWYIDSYSHYSINNYLFAIPDGWADEYTDGRMMATGRFRDGGWSGMGPSLYAYKPWIDDAGTPAPDGTRLEVTVLLQYAKSNETDSIERCLDGYQHGDEWEGGAWITTESGNSAVLFAGTKSTGDRYWYGFLNAAGSEKPCLPEAFIGQFTLCRSADGTPCPDEEAWICDEPASGRGWWSSRFSAQIILYDPADLAKTARGEIEPWEPQPYAVFEIDDYLFHNPSGIETENIGSGVQRRYQIGDVAYDIKNNLLYVMELFADEARPVVHVWEIDI
ncbi:MAG: hypothetical protein ISR78_05610 [Spirochaetia bacterium]|nr:hypothetical protein [Spirochaetia bacterium]